MTSPQSRSSVDTSGEDAEDSSASGIYTFAEESGAPRKKGWQAMSDEHFKEALISEEDLKSKPRKLRKFYQDQNLLVQSFLKLDKMDEEAGTDIEKEQRCTCTRTNIAIYGSFCVNVTLFCLKVVAAATSGSLSVIASALVCYSL